MVRTPDEVAQTTSFNSTYELARTPVMQAITDEICCCGYVGTSWTTRAEAEIVCTRLHLDSTTKLLELGAGAGWPGLHLAQRSGCKVMLVDLPEAGLRLARERAASDGIASQVETCVADASELPFSDGAFTALNHSDLLCCLVAKRRVLEECRRVIAPSGRMTFSVIAVAPGLTAAETSLAIENGPPFVAADGDYDAMLAQTGWQVLERSDLTLEYERACARALAADTAHTEALEELIGTADVALRVEKWERKLSAIRRRFLLRHLYLAAPA